MSVSKYSQRKSAISSGQREWRIEPDALVVHGTRKEKGRVRWADVACVRLGPAPTRLKPWRYIFELRVRDGRAITIDNAHWLRFAAYEDRSSDFTPFVLNALRRIEAANPKARALVGDACWRHNAYLVLALAGLAAAATALILAPTPLDALPGAWLIKLALVLLMLPAFAFWILKAFPRGAALHNLPETALPPVQEPRRAA